MRRSAALRRIASFSALALGAAIASLAAIATPAGRALAQRPAPPGQPAGAATDAGAPRAARRPSIDAPCTEQIPQGATRPKVTTTFPAKGLAGYAAMLEVDIEHGKGETVHLDKLRLLRGTRAGRGLDKDGFALPEPDGGAPIAVTTTDSGSLAKTRVSIPVLLLPKTAGRHDLELPPLPIDVARANGDVMTLCTDRHAIVVDEPIANEADPKVRPNPEPRRQKEPFELAKWIALALAIGVVIGALALWAWLRHRKRPREVAAPPQKLPWVAALEELDELSRSKLLAKNETVEYVGRLSEVLRKYLGARYGFDGLESTTDEIRSLLRRVRPPIHELGRIGELLTAFDLVKFARVVPAKDECKAAFDKTLGVVRATTPNAAAAAMADGSPGVGAAADAPRSGASPAARASTLPSAVAPPATVGARAAADDAASADDESNSNDDEQGPADGRASRPSFPEPESARAPRDVEAGLGGPDTDPEPLADGRPTLHDADEADDAPGAPPDDAPDTPVDPRAPEAALVDAPDALEAPGTLDAPDAPDAPNTPDAIEAPPLASAKPTRATTLKSARPEAMPSERRAAPTSDKPSKKADSKRKSKRGRGKGDS